MELIRIDPSDNVAVALEALCAGAECVVNGQTVTLLDDIPFGHKIALKNIAAGEDVIKYAGAIGRATKVIKAGEHVHVHNLKTNLMGMAHYQYKARSSGTEKTKAPRFAGYRRSDGRVGTRNELWIVPTVGCVNFAAEKVAKLSRERYGEFIDDAIALTHNMGCSQLGEDQQRTMRILSGLISNPNAGGVLVLSLGCENNNLDVFRPYLDGVEQSRLRFLVAQDVENETEAAMELIGQLVDEMKKDRRESVSAENLTIGFKCGGSDAFSGITANALCGRITDMATGWGASAILTEVPEMFGAEDRLMERAQDFETFASIVDMINSFKEYYTRHDQPIYENPSPGNKQGGISTMEEKSLGCIQKGGKAVVTDVLCYGGQVKKRGLNLLTGPGNDQVSCTNLAASGANIIIFTTGRGTPLGSVVPTIKLSSNSELARKKRGWIDWDAGELLQSGDFDKAAEEFLSYILDVASGIRQTQNEKNGDKGISIFRDGVIL